MSRRVVITGLGAVTPIGNNVEDFWANIKKGTVGIGPITKFDTTDYKAHLGAEVKDFDPTTVIDKKASLVDNLIQLFSIDFPKEIGHGNIFSIVSLRNKPFQLFIDQINKTQAIGKEL